MASGMTRYSQRSDATAIRLPLCANVINGDAASIRKESNKQVFFFMLVFSSDNAGNPDLRRAIFDFSLTTAAGSVCRARSESAYLARSANGQDGSWSLRLWESEFPQM